MKTNHRPLATIFACAAAMLLASGTPDSLAAQTESRPAARSTPAMPAVEAVVPTITATGSATVSRAPDQAVVTLGVATVGRTSTEAQQRLNTTMEKIVAAIKGLSLPDLKVQTQWLSLSPVYEHIDHRSAAPDEPREPRIIGYNASNTLRITVPDVNKVGTVIDAGIEAGANQVHGLSFELRDDRDARQEALSAAARDAKGKSEAIAAALGLRVVRIVEVQSGPVARPMPVARMRGFAAESMAMAAPTTVEPGEVTVHEQVTVTVEVAPL